MVTQLKNITEAEWFSGGSKNANRRIRWNILGKLGASDNEKRRIRDWDDINRVKNYTIQPTVKRRRISKAIKGTSNRKSFWKELSRYWQYKDDDLRKTITFNSWNSWQRKASVDWYKESIKINNKLWENMSSHDKKLLNIREAEKHSHGFIAVYRHYVLGRSWEKSLSGLEISPFADPFEDVS